MSEVVIGIDLGTTFSTTAYVDSHGKPTSISNSTGDYLTPSAILFEGENIVIGREAAKTSAFMPTSYVDCFKRFMGQESAKTISGIEIPAEVLSGFLLRKLKQDVESQLGKIEKAVITVPAYFDDLRRQATFSAAHLAGLEVLAIINEPTAAAIAHGYTTRSHDGQAKTLLVYDLGGGTFDVSILEVKEDEFVTIATDGDVYLGGKDFDERIVNHLAEAFKNEHGVDPRQDNHDLAQMWLDAEEIKRTLSERTKTAHVMFYGGQRCRVEITREEFEDATADLCARTRTTTRLVLKDAGMDLGDIDDYLIVGGSGRMPMVKKMLVELFQGREPAVFGNPDLAVGHGAAILANSLSARSEHSIKLINVNSHSLGVIGRDNKTNRRINAILIPKNTSLPFTAQKQFVTAKTDQRKIIVNIVEGESENPEHCSFLGRCSIDDLPSGLPEGEPIQVEFSYDTVGRLAVSARLTATRQSTHAVIERKRPSGKLTLDQWHQKIIGKDEPQKKSEAKPEKKTKRSDAGFDDKANLRRELQRTLVKIADDFVENPPQLPPGHPIATQMGNVLNSNAALKTMEEQFSVVEKEKGKMHSQSKAVLVSAEHASLQSQLEKVSQQNKLLKLQLSREILNEPAIESYDIQLARALMDKLEIVSS